MSNKQKWNPSKDDIEIVCDAILERFIEEDPSRGDCCLFCFKVYGNYKKRFSDKGIREPHEVNCPVLVAQDIMTGFPNAMNPAQETGYE